MNKFSNLLLAVSAVTLCACSGDGSSSASTSGGTTTGGATGGTTGGATTSCTLTSVDAGLARIAGVGASVAFDASLDESPAGCSTITWSQMSGAAATIANTSAEDASVTLPSVSASETLVFEISADDGAGTVLSDQVSVEVWVPADSSVDRTVLADFSDRPGWQCDVDPVVASSVTTQDQGMETAYTVNEIPGHATGTFPNNGNPHTITEQAKTFFINNSPVMTSTATDMAEFGITIEGVRLERDTAESYQNARVWSYEAITPGLAERSTSAAEFQWLGTDCSNAHVQPSGAYHYHGMMEGLINSLGETNDPPADMVLGGYAADGFPFYLRYGYVDAADPLSGLQVLEGSWEVRSGTRASGPGGAYDGTFREDWEFVSGSGDLDECNGRFGPTPEFPAGIYHYYVTDDYPYIPRCVFGTPDTSFRTR